MRGRLPPLLAPTMPAPLAARYRTDGFWRPTTLWSTFAATARRHGDRRALVEGTRTVGFAGLAVAAERLASGLAGLGVGRGDVIAYQLPNWEETVVALLATARLGAVAAPVQTTHRERDVGFILRATRARALLIPGCYRGFDHRTRAATLRPDLHDLAVLVVVRDEPSAGMHAFDTVATAHAAGEPPATDAEAIALVMHTSGSTADPKGVLHSHATLLAEAYSLGPAHGVTASDTVLMPSPLTHVSGLVHALLVPAALGTAAVLMDRWDAGDALRMIARERVTYMVGAPIFLRDLAQHPERAAHDLSSFRLFSCGGADVDPTLVRTAAAALGCVAKRVYGSTEFPTISTCLPDDPPERCITTEGRPIGAAEIRLVDDDERPVGVDVEGEVLARGPECCLGYLDPDLNAEAFTPDGWLRTGDLGVLDAHGFLRITGRKKDIIIRKGENISAREIEDLLATHPDLAEVAVLGLADPVCGEIACAAVRVRAGAAPPTLGGLGDFLAARGLPTRKRPERLVIVAEFPRAPSGKIVKRALRARLGG